MTSQDRNILMRFAERLHRQFPQAKVWAYGSRVRGQATPESDLDVCVVLQDYNEEIQRQISDIAWEVSVKFDLLVTTLVYSQEEFERGPCSITPLVRSILKEGVPA